MAKTLLASLALLVLPLLLSSAAQTTQATPRTMRLDFYHTGNSAGEVFSLDRVVLEPLPWPGNPRHAVDDSNLGKYFFEVRDAATNRPLHTVPVDNGPYEITFTDPDGATIKNLAAGEYDVKVEDLSDIHNFHLKGSGVSESTAVGEKAETTWHVNFSAGDYSFVCDPHASQMSGEFHVS